MVHELCSRRAVSTRSRKWLDKRVGAPLDACCFAICELLCCCCGGGGGAADAGSESVSSHTELMRAQHEAGESTPALSSPEPQATRSRSQSSVGHNEQSVVNERGPQQQPAAAAGAIRRSVADAIAHQQQEASMMTRTLRTAGARGRALPDDGCHDDPQSPAPHRPL